MMPQFEEDEKPLAYLLPRRIVLEGRLTKFSEVCELLLPVYHWKDIPKYCFVSHRWLYPDSPDNSFWTFSAVLLQYATQAPEIEYFWIDYACLPYESNLKKNMSRELPTVLELATAFVIMPFALSSTSLVPVSNIQMYCFRAWCAVEFAAMMHRPRDITLTRLTRTESNLKVAFVSLPSCDKKDNVVTLVNSFVVLKDIVLRDDFDSFSVFYSITSSNERALVWDILHDQADLISETEPDLASFLDQATLHERAFYAYENDTDRDSQTYSELDDFETDPPVENFEHHLYDIKIVDGKETVVHPTGYIQACNCNCEIEPPKCSMM